MKKFTITTEGKIKELSEKQQQFIKEHNDKILELISQGKWSEVAKMKPSWIFSEKCIEELKK